MPDIHIERHGDRWAVKESPDAMPIFESYTLQEAESDARRRAEGGRILVSGDDAGPEGPGPHAGSAQDGPEPHELREDSAPVRPSELVREQQAGL